MTLVSVSTALVILLEDEEVGTGLVVDHEHLDVRTGFVIDREDFLSDRRFGRKSA